MGKGSGKPSDGRGAGGRGGGLDHADFLLWKEFTRDIDPLEEPDWEALERDVHAAPQQKKTENVAPSDVSLAPTVPLPQSQTTPLKDYIPQLDARTDARLRRGQMPIEGKLDLHGCTQDEAHRRLNEFVIGAQSRGKRCVLVITGKGLSRGGGLNDAERTTGILRQKLPLWLSIAPLRGLVLKAYPAVQRDGGTGACYLYLKRNRDY